MSKRQLSRNDSCVEEKSPPVHTCQGEVNVNMYTSLFEEYFETERQSVLEEARDVAREDQKQRNKQLQDFIEDFIESEEYEEYVNQKRRILKTEAATQYCDDDYLQSAIEEEKTLPRVKKKYPLTEKTKRIFAFEAQFNRYVANEEKREILKKQEKGIKLIKAKLDELREAYHCNVDLIARKRKKEFKSYVQEFCNDFNFNLSHLNAHNRYVAENKIVRYKKSLYKKQLERKRKIARIVKKITEDLTIKKPAKKSEDTCTKQNRAPESEVGKIEDVATLPETGTNSNQTNEKDVRKSETVKTGEDLATSPKISTKSTQTKEKSARESEKEIREKNSKIERALGKIIEYITTMKNNATDIEIAPPETPIRASSSEISQAVVAKLAELLEEFLNFDDTMEDVFLEKKRNYPTDGFDVDEYFICRPKTLTFDSFDFGKTYKKSVVVTNKTNVVLKFIYNRMEFSTEYDKLCFEVRPLMDVIKLAPGRGARFFVKFTPHEMNYLIEGAVQFLTYNYKTLKPASFSIRVRCVPKHTDLKIHSNKIEFGTVPYWSSSTVKGKALKLRNDGTKRCFLVITRNPNPLEIPEEPGDEVTYLSDILDEIYQNVFSHVRLENNFITLGAREHADVRATLANIEHVGSYFEKFGIDVYEESKNGALVGSHEVLFTAEISGHVLHLNPQVLDFGVCFVNSIYQTSFNVHNSSSSTLTVFTKYPAPMTAYVKCNVSSISIPPAGTKQIWLKLLPRQSVYDLSKYYNRSTSVLEFPVYVSVSSRKNMPPAVVTAMAVLAQHDGVQIRPTEDAHYQNGVLDFGKCTIYESVYVDLEITNVSIAKQIYGFVNLPEFVTIHNFGFGELLPGEVKTLRLFFQPGYSDFEKFPPEQKFNEQRLEFTVKVETMANIGQMKSKMTCDNLRRSIGMVFKELARQTDWELRHKIEVCKKAIRKEFYPKSEEFVENLRMENVDIEPDFTQLKCTAIISRPLLEFSHQHIEFPPTACGSYSFKEIQLRAFDGVVGRACDAHKRSGLKMMPHYEAFFRITGTDDDVKVEPNCGILTKGETKKILFVVKPSTPAEILTQIANSLNRSESITTSKLRRKNPDKKDANADFKRLSRSNLLEYFPAEMLYWRNMEPYEIESRFVCEIRYNSRAALSKNFDRIYVQTSCKVTRPDFITDLKLQRIEFGVVPVGIFKSEHIRFQNIKYEDVALKPSLLNPTGPFRLSYTKKLLLSPEHYLKLPIEFRPRTAGHFEEYFEVMSDTTTLPLILEGDAIVPVIEFSPKFLVCRMKSGKESLTECLINITNESSVDITLKFEKVCELEGYIHMAYLEDDEIRKKSKASVRNKNEIVLECLTEELHEVEQKSIRNQFETSNGDTRFQILDAQNGEVHLSTASRSASVRICFGRPETLKKLLPKIKTKHQNNELLKNSVTLNETTKYYVAKYNVTLGDEFIKDFIFVCSIK